MALACSSSRVLCSTTPAATHRPLLKPNSSFPWWSHQVPRRTTLNFTVVSASPKKQQLSSSSSSPRTGRFDSKNRRTSPTVTKEEDDEEEETVRDDEMSSGVAFDDGFVMPELPGDKPDLFEGPQWDGLGFFVQYMWAFGIVFALAACGIAVATYNEGATDFKDTPAYKESMESRDLLEIPDASNSDVFESNPTEEAPSLE